MGWLDLMSYSRSTLKLDSLMLALMNPSVWIPTPSECFGDARHCEAYEIGWLRSCSAFEAQKSEQSC